MIDPGETLLTNLTYIYKSEYLVCELIAPVYTAITAITSRKNVFNPIMFMMFASIEGI